MLSRRDLLGQAAAALAAAPLDPAAAPRLAALFAAADRDGRTPAELAGDESFWREVQLAFRVDRSLTNLNNGGTSPAPGVVHDKYVQRLGIANDAPPYHMWELQEPARDVVRQQCAAAFGCDAEELAFTRNASESLMTVQHGLDLRRGDEVLTTDQDYPRMLQAFRQRERRQGIVQKQIELPVPCVDDADVVQRFAAAITTRTKLLLVCHVINLTGQVLPVRAICAMARERGVPVLVDGAHAIAHLPFRIDEIGCDFYGASLHKWLFAPIGTGLLWVRKDRIPGVWPLFAAAADKDADIRKFEEVGTHPAAPALGVGEALVFHQGLGVERKLARLQLLRDRWVQALAGLDRVRLHTDLTPGRAGAIATVALDGVDTGRFATHLWTRHRILTAPIPHPRCSGLRISPSVYTTLAEIDRFVAAFRDVHANGLPA